ncbi:uncharacterized protein LOC141633012 [Silene latifolia]|uniref:uncharacterized protein LOC141633012 n=1 Tax=Silene latifolia TaxID=37657 RepID=UPI003D77BA15
MGGMGFRYFKLFNLALLGKQAWRLVTEPESLWAQMMRAKYYVNGDFMTASLGHNPSYTWRGIMEARKALDVGDIIGNIRLSASRPPDAWYWEAEKDGNYSVKTAYRLLAGADAAMEFGDMSEWEREKWLWNRLWKVPVWPRVKLFFWQLCSEALPTGINIAFRVREHRNKVIFEAREVQPERVIQRCRDVLDEIEGGGFISHGGREGRRVENQAGERVPAGWIGAPDGFVKINVDAGSKEGVGVGLGAVCRDGGGGVVWGLTIVHEQVWEPHIAEAVSVLEGLKEARQRGHGKVVVESDCLQVINALKTKKKGRSNFNLVLDDIFLLCSSFISVVWSYTCRANNSVAHELAHVHSYGSGKFV